MIRRVAILSLVIAFFVISWICVEQNAVKKAIPPATSLKEFLDVRPSITKVRQFERGGSVYFEILGEPSTSLLSLPSGPPAYIFDEKGKLVDWAADSGDAPEFVAKWGSFSQPGTTYINAKQVRQSLRPL